MRRVITACHVAAALLVAPTAFADTCYDQNNKNFDCNSQPQRAGATEPAARQKQPPGESLRDKLHRLLDDKNTNNARRGTQADAERFRDRILEARARAQAALDNPSAPDARQRYEQAVKDMGRAYDAAADVFPEKSDEILRQKQADEAYAASEAARVGWGAAEVAAPAPDAAATEAASSETSHVGVGERGHVFVCDGPVDAPKVSCREIQSDGRLCLAVIAFETQVNWRDSTTTPCSDADLAQRDAFLAQHPEEAARVAAATMNDRCTALAMAFFRAANANDGPAAKEAYEALKSEGGCGVLAHIKPPATPNDSEYGSVLAIGRQIGVMLGQTVAPMPPRSAPAPSNANAPGGVRTNYGQGGATKTAPPNRSTITGLGGGSSEGGGPGTSSLGAPPTAATVKITVPAERTNTPNPTATVRSGGSSMQSAVPTVRAPTVDVTMPRVNGPTVDGAAPTVNEPTVSTQTKAAAALSNPECTTLLRTYVSAAQAGDGPRSAAAYDALKQAGGCGVLDQVASQPKAAPADPRFVSRGDTPMLNQTVAACDKQQAACAQVVNQLRAGTSSEATAALYQNAISVGLSLGGALSSAIVPTPTVNLPAQPDMRSLAPARIRTTYGQGSPTKIAPVSKPSSITGLGQQ